MEIERKYLVDQLPKKLEAYKFVHIEQRYISADPTIRIRRINNDHVLTVKSGGTLAVEEFELPITKEAFNRLKEKTEGYPIVKTRYYIPLVNGYIAELDIYDTPFDGLVTVEVEFASLDAANTFTPPPWFGGEVTYDYRYKNSSLSIHGPDSIQLF